MAEVRQRALNERARANAIVSTKHGSAIPTTLDPNAGATESGSADIMQRGQLGAELRPTIMSAEQEIELALAEVPGLLSDAFSAADVAEFTAFIRQNAENPEHLAQRGCVLRLVQGPDGELVRWAQLHTWTPETPYPDSQTEPGTRVLHARRLLALARDRARTRLRYGDEIAAMAVKSPFRRGIE